MNRLVIVGSGIKFYSHLTVESIAHIEKADIVLYLAVEPAMEEWVRTSNKNTESLYPLYNKYERRIDCYRAITNRILEVLQNHPYVTVVFYGHPLVFVTSALDAAMLAKKMEYEVDVLPGISAEDCLFADLLVNPGSCGCQSFEATDFLVRERLFSSTSHLIIWQVGIIGALGAVVSHNNKAGIMLLVDCLSVQYDLSHTVILYEAAQYPKFKPRIEKIELKALESVNLSDMTTLYIPPAKTKKCNDEILKKLGIKRALLQ